MGQPTISIHALLAESDTANRTDPSAILDFYPRSPCGERPSAAHASKASTLNFYPRSPCGERQRPSRKTDRLQPFLSTLSLRRATFGVAVFEHTVVISIHALLAESDHSGGPWQAVYMDFYPRSPCGERLQVLDAVESHYHISIHALLAESDVSLYVCAQSGPYFYPRSPCGERRLDVTIIGRTWDISIHALLAESD